MASTQMALADHYWTGRGETSDYTDAGNWINELTNGNTVFGGAKVSELPDEASQVTFSSLYTSANRLWVENNLVQKPGVIFDVSADAAADAGWTTTHGSEPSWTIGTDNGGELTIRGGTYTLPKGIFIATGAQDGSLTMEGGVLNVATKFCVSTAARTGTLTLNGGTINCTLTSGDALAIGKNGTGILNMNGGAINCATGFYLAQDSGSGTLNMTGGKITVSGGNNVVFARGYNSAVTSTVNLVGGEIESWATVQAGVERNYSALDMRVDNGAKLLIVNGKELVFGTAKTVIALGVTNGTVRADGKVSFGSNGSSSAEVTLEEGEISSVNGRIYVAEYGTAAMTVNGGSVTWGDQLMVAYQAGSTGTLTINGGRVASPDHLLQVGLNGNGTYVQNGGSVACSSFRLGTDSATSVGAATLNGGSLETEYVSVGSGTGTLVLNGGWLKATADTDNFIYASDNLTVSLGAGGASFDTAGHAVTVPATLANDEGLDGNAPIAKRGVGTLTLSADLDLARQFTFTIDDGIGPIALAGANNSLAEGKQIEVAVDPVSATVNTPYTVLKGLAEDVTIEDIVLTSLNDNYACTGAVADGSLVVTLTTTAATTARYVDGEWRFYDADGQLIADGKAADITRFVFTGVEPAGEVAAAIASGHAVVLEAKTQGETPVTNTFALAASLTSGRVSTDVDAGCAVRIVGQGEITFAPEVFSFVNTLIFASEGENSALTIAADLTSETAGRVVFDAGTINFNGEINQDLEVNGKFVRTAAWTPKLYFFGTGEIELLGARLTIAAGDNGEKGTEWFQGFNGALTLGVGGELEDLTLLHAESADQGSYYFLGTGTLLRMAGGTVTCFGMHRGAGSNNECLMNVEVADGTTNIWYNYQSRSGWDGCNVNVDGTVTGAGTLVMKCNGGSNARHYRFANSDLTEFGGTLVIEGESTWFGKGIGGAKVIATAGSAVVQSSTAPLAVANAELTLQGDHGAKQGSWAWSPGDYVIGEGATLKVGEGAAVHGLTFNPGSSLQLIDEGALGDRKTNYLAFTSATPVTLTKTTPALVGAQCTWGRWQLVQEEVTETTEPTEEGEEATTTTVYRIWAKLSPRGSVVILR
ncbi:MAG: hypothetical protein ACI4RD_05400 [Kiritimatiellia bacterium]